MKKPQTFKSISRAIDEHGVHYLDAIDDQGRHWTAEMQRKEEPWLTYTQEWLLKLY